MRKVLIFLLIIFSFSSCIKHNIKEQNKLNYILMIYQQMMGEILGIKVIG